MVASTTNKVQGTGLGMAITKSIVELMGGTIEVTSEVNRGSLFCVELELRILEDQTDRQFWEKHGIRRILALIGSQECRENIRALVTDAGLEVETAGSLEEALRLLPEGDFQLALLDWEAFDGVQTARDIRKAVPSSPILFLAEYDADGIEKALKNGRAGVLTKPFFLSAFRQKVEELWSGAETPESQQDASLEGLRFLAAEDNEINAEILAELLSMEGAGCEIVENGQLAVERFQQSAEGEFDAILMDVQMPVMNGHDASRAIRALSREDAGRIPIIAMTANAFAEDEKAALAAGMDAHVAKPLDLGLLKKVIRDRKSVV